MLLYNVSGAYARPEKNYVSYRPQSLSEYADGAYIRRKTMKIFKRAVSIFLALALLFALTACGNDGSGAALSYPSPSPSALTRR